MIDAPIPDDLTKAALDRMERAAMAYERLGRLTKDDEKTRQIRKDAIAELAAARHELLSERSRNEERIAELERVTTELCAASEPFMALAESGSRIHKAIFAARAALGGTADMVKRAEAAGIEVRRVTSDLPSYTGGVK